MREPDVPTNRAEDFFVERIRRGLELAGERLSAAEEAFLRMPLAEIPKGSPLPPDQAFRLHRRWLEALSRAYSQELRKALLAGPAQGEGAAPWWAGLPGQEWRDKLRHLSQTSDAGISSVAEDWYARHGRAVEQREMSVGGAVDSGFAVPPPLIW